MPLPLINQEPAISCVVLQIRRAGIKNVFLILHPVYAHVYCAYLSSRWTCFQHDAVIVLPSFHSC